MALCLLAAACTVLAIPGAAVADGSPAPDNRFYASAMMSGALGWDHSSGKGVGFFLGFGKPVTDHFGLELNFQQYNIQTDPDYGGFSVRERTYGINGLFFLHRGQRWTPYLELGAGRVNSSYNGTHSNNTYLTAGAGFFWRVASHLSIRGDVRFNDLPSGIGSTANSAALQYPVASVGIVTQFGDPPAARLVTTPPPSPAPVDSDGDGVPDDLDQYPNTPPGTKVHAQCCPIKPSIEFPGIHFAFNSTKLTAEDKHTLDDAAKKLNKDRDINVLVSGYTDSIGTAAYNRKFSEARAASVKQYLVAHDVALDRLTTRGHGENDPVASNKTAEGRAKNRRVELRVVEHRKTEGMTTPHP
ncbi:MAG: OmpA family protein [Gammaproteobacteria bacterium]